jgi:hypothetical protein
LYLTSHLKGTLRGDFAAQEGTAYRESLQDYRKEFCRKQEGNSAAIENGNSAEIYRGILQHCERKFCNNIQGYNTIQGYSTELYRGIL